MTQPAFVATGAHLVIYDGLCGLCHRLVRFLLKRDRRGWFVFAAHQSALARGMLERFGANPDEPVSLYVVAHYRTDDARAFDRSGAALFIAGRLGWPWKAVLIARLLPAVFLDRMYEVIARHRYRVFGRYDACAIPPREFEDRFIG